jgi:16S rRNA (cytosine1402-N4)-methyltransferase
MSKPVATRAPGHDPVMLEEVIAWLQPQSPDHYIDATFGGGGHSRALLEASSPDGRVLAIDADAEAVARGRMLSNEPDFAGRLHLVHGNFVDLVHIAGESGFAPVQGILMDLGLSSFQLDDPDRGFAFRFDGPIDMRFDQSRGTPAGDLVNTQDVVVLADILWRYGDETRSRRIAAAIVREREESPILTTGRLAKIVERAVGGRKGSDTHPATRTFQALRIAVNNELSVLERTLAGAVELLSPGGRLAVISFHSLEDRIVKQFIQRESVSCVCPPEQPVCTCNHQPRLRALTRAVKPSSGEITWNPRSRSAVLRVAERLP